MGFVQFNLHVFFSGMICGPFDFIYIFFFLGHCYNQNIRRSINVSSKLDLDKHTIANFLSVKIIKKNSKIFLTFDVQKCTQ